MLWINLCPSDGRTHRHTKWLLELLSEPKMFLKPLWSLDNSLLNSFFSLSCFQVCELWLNLFTKQTQAFISGSNLQCSVQLINNANYDIWFSNAVVFAPNPIISPNAYKTWVLSDFWYFFVILCKMSFV